MTVAEPSGPIGLVLAGGGARGAYEIGALSALLPALPSDERPEILLGTSVGAINTAYLAANLHRPLDDLVEQGLALWRSISFREVLRPLLSLAELSRLGAYAGEILGLPGSRPASLLDPEPLRATLARLIDFPQIHRNVDEGLVRAAAVAATSADTDLSVVFHDGGPTPPYDTRRGIEYIPTPLDEDHVRASAAIPLLFPAVPVSHTDKRGWYFDGGTRLNTPIKPALALGAERLIVVALNSTQPRRAAAHPPRPDALDGATQLIQAVLVDPLVTDIQTLATINEMLADTTPQRISANERRTGRRRVPYILISPEDPDAIGRIAAEVYRRYFASARGLARSPDMAALGRLLAAGESSIHGELFSYLFFAREFAERLIELGRRDGERWLAQDHDEGLWQIGPPPGA